MPGSVARKAGSLYLKAAGQRPLQVPLAIVVMSSVMMIMMVVMVREKTSRSSDSRLELVAEFRLRIEPAMKECV